MIVRAPRPGTRRPEKRRGHRARLLSVTRRQQRALKAACR